MKTKTIELSFETAKIFLNSGNEQLKQIAEEAFPELIEKPKRWEDLRKISGYYNDEDSNTEKINENPAKDFSRNIFKTKEQAEAVNYMAMLSQLMYVYNDGWEPDWSDGSNKHIIYLYGKVLELGITCYTNFFFSFKDKETAELFLKNFADYIEKARPLL